MTRTVLADDLLSTDILADPYVYFERVRATAPTHWNAVHQMWVLTRYQDCAAALRDQRLASDTFTPFYDNLPAKAQVKWRPLRNTLTSWLSFMDPPSHTRLRRVITKAFTPRVIEAMRPVITEAASGLLDDALDTDGRIDLVPNFAYPLPARVIALMLGVNAADLWIIHEWAQDILLVSLGGEAPDRFQRAQSSILEFKEYLRPLIADRKARPRQHDLLTELVTAEDDGRRLRDDEILATAILLLIAGHETTRNLIANAIVNLLRHPEQLQSLCNDTSLLASAVEEVLRFDGPVKGRVRHVTAPLEVGAALLQPGDRVFIATAAANRDPGQFADPGSFIVTRRENRHLGFGTGSHFCLGAPLARLEAQIALGLMIRYQPGLSLETNEIEYDRKLVMRSAKSVVLSFDLGVRSGLAAMEADRPAAF